MCVPHLRPCGTMCIVQFWIYLCTDLYPDVYVIVYLRFISLLFFTPTSTNFFSGLVKDKGYSSVTRIIEKKNYFLSNLSQKSNSNNQLCEKQIQQSTGLTCTGSNHDMGNTTRRTIVSTIYCWVVFLLVLLIPHDTF